VEQPLILGRKRKRIKRKQRWLLPDPNSRFPFPGESRLSFMKRVSDSNFTNFVRFYRNTLGLSRKQLRNVNYHLPPEIIEKLSRYTGVSDHQLIETGFEKWVGVIPDLELFWRSKDQQWVCFECLREEPSYYRLEWSMGFVTACSKHQRLIINRCPNNNCSKPLQFWFLDWKDSLSTCYYCNQDINQLSSAVSSDTKLEPDDPFFESEQLITKALDIGYWNVFNEKIPLVDFFRGLRIIAMLVNRVLLSNQWSILPQSQKINKNVFKLLEQYKILLKRFKTTVTYPEVNHIVVGMAIHLLQGSIEQLSKITTVDQNYFNRITTRNSPNFLKPFMILQPKYTPKTTRKKHDLELKYLKATEIALEKIKKNDYPITVKAVAKEIGVHKKTLKNYQKSCKMIEEAKKNYIPEREIPVKKKEKLPPNIKQFVEKKVEPLILDFDPISFRRVTIITGIHRDLLVNDLSLRNIIVNAINRQLDYWKRQVEKVCNQLLSNGEEITNIIVAEKLGIYRKRISRNEMLCQIVDNFKERQAKSHVVQIMSAINTLKQQNEIITYSKVADILGAPMKYISEIREYRLLVDEEREKQRKELLTSVKIVVDKLVEERGRISCRAVALQLKISQFLVLEDNEFNKLVQDGKSRLQEILKKDIQSACNALINSGEEVNYDTIAKLGIPVWRIKKNEELRKIVIAHKSIIQEKELKYWKSEVDAACKELINSGEPVDNKTVAAKLGIPDHKIKYNPELRKIVIAHKSIIQEKQLKYWKSEVDAACKELANSGEPVNYQAVADKLGIGVHIIKTNPELKNIVNKDQNAACEYLKSEVDAACKELVNNGELVNYQAVANKLGISYYKIRDNPELKNIVNKDRNAVCEYLKSEVDVACKELINSGETVNYQTVAVKLGIPYHRIKSKPELRKIVNKYQEIKKLIIHERERLEKSIPERKKND
jgi:hypothetical protein